jgi:NPCBM-associated, NEW3 domain of alpha-galactosidase/Carbohydrate esterase 2 N-terminal
MTAACREGHTLRTANRLAAITAFCLAAAGLSTAGAAGATAAAAQTSAASQPTVLYASADGTGTACDFSAPCSLPAAKARVERLNDHMTADIDVDLFGGTYHVPGGFQLGPADSGSNGYTVVWQAVPGQTPVISGAGRITGFTEYDSSRGIWRARVPAASAAAGGQQLFVNGQRAQLARSAGSPPGLQVTATGFSTTDPGYASFTNQSQIEVVDNSDWKHESCPVSSITAAPGGGSDINILPSCWDANNRNVPNLGFPYNGAGLPAMSGISYVENAQALLTQPGQFYLDQAGHYLYYIPEPGQDMTTADVELPVQQSLLTLQGTPGHLAPVNQNAPGASYSGSGWQTYGDRGLGDLGNDVAATTNNGDSVSYTFTGTSLEVLAETNSDEGSFDVYVDGKQDTSQNFTENTSGNTRLAQQVVYSVQGLPAGTHTVQIVKTGGQYLTIDGFSVVPDAVDPVHDIAFRHIGFEYSTWNLPVTTGYIDNQAGILWDTSGATPVPAKVPAAVTVSRGSGISFTDDVFRHLGATAIGLADGTQNSTVAGSIINDTAGGGVSVGEVDDYFQNDTALMTTGDTLSDNVISYVGQDYADTVGVWAGYTRDLTVTHNDIGHTPYSGMSLGWGWGYASPCSMQAAQGLSSCEHGTNYAGGNQITDNYIHDVMNTLFDGGPIYTNGGQGSDGAGVQSILAGNYVSIANHTNNMLYQDEGSSYWHTYGNVVNFAAGADWIGMWTPTINNITIGPDNYSSTTAVNNNGTDISYTAPTVVSNGAWPAAAAAIMSAAGPRDRVAPRVYDDDSQALSYAGDWSAQGTLSDQGDTHTTTSAGAAVSLRFTGRSIAFVAGPSGGAAAISIDGKPAGQVNTDAFGTPGQTVFTDTSLPPGGHTITVTDVSGELTIGEFQAPALPYLNVRSSGSFPAAGAPITITATVGDPGRLPLRDTSVSLLVPSGWSAGKPVSVGTVQPGGTAAATFTVTPPPSQAPGTVSFTAVASYHGTGGTGHGGQRVLVGSTQAQTPYSSLPAAFDNVGVSADSSTSAADLDGSGYSFSATALANAGVTPGSGVTAGGLSFTWPSAAAGSVDNVVASGQEIAVNRSGSEIGFLETATYGPAQGQGTIIYADGSTQSFTLSAPDWYSGPPAGSSATITMAYRNAPGNGQDNHPVYVYEQSVPLDSTAQVAGVVLPDVSQGLSAGSAALHIFALTVGG